MGQSLEMDASEALIDLACIAIDHGVESLEGGRPFTSFIIICAGNDRKLIRFSAESLESGLSHAGEYVSNNAHAIDTYAIAHDGYAIIQGQRYDAVLVEAAERNGLHAYVFAQRYKTNERTHGIEPVGNVAFIGKARSRLMS